MKALKIVAFAFAAWLVLILMIWLAAQGMAA